MREPKTQTLTASAAHQVWSQLLDQISRGETRIIVERNGSPVAALISAEDFEWLTQREAERAERFKILDEIRARNLDKDPDEVERDVAEEMRPQPRRHRTRTRPG